RPRLIPWLGSRLDGLDVELVRPRGAGVGEEEPVLIRGEVEGGEAAHFGELLGLARGHLAAPDVVVARMLDVGRVVESAAVPAPHGVAHLEVALGREGP